MAGYGSLFLHHIKLEGRPLANSDGGDPLLGLLSDLPPYQRGREEIRAFRTVLSDVRLSISRAHSPAFELAVVATALRHAFILGCYVSKKPDFGRTSPFRTLAPDLGLTSSGVDALTALYDFRLHQHGRSLAPFEATTAIISEWLMRAHGLFQLLGEKVDDFYQAVH
jgi:hypothetical protein